MLSSFRQRPRFTTDRRPQHQLENNSADLQVHYAWLRDVNAPVDTYDIRELYPDLSLLVDLMFSGFDNRFILFADKLQSQ